jgi:hypothetical protein
MRFKWFDARSDFDADSLDGIIQRVDVAQLFG